MDSSASSDNARGRRDDLGRLLQWRLQPVRHRDTPNPMLCGNCARVWVSSCYGGAEVTKVRAMTGVPAVIPVPLLHDRRLEPMRRMIKGMKTLFVTPCGSGAVR